VSEKALELCEKNAAGQEVQIKTVLDNILSQPSAIHYPEFDIIVSNPPYVTESEKTEMQPNVLDFEPQQALFVDDTDALIYYRQICDFAVRHLKPDGLLFFEINQRFGKEVIEMLEHSQMKRIELRKDLFGRDRMIRAEKRIVNKTY